MVERFNGRISDILKTHHFRSGEDLRATLHRYVDLYNHQLPQAALRGKTPLQAMKDWFKSSPELSIEGLMIVRDVTPGLTHLLVARDTLTPRVAMRPT